VASSKHKKEQQQKWSDERIARSSRFVACLFLGSGQYAQREASTIENVRLRADGLLKEFQEVRYGRGVLIYAITPGDELNIFVESRNMRGEDR
jgi:hypothetical protein